MSVKALRSRRKCRLLLSSRQAHGPRKMLQRQLHRRSKPCHSSQTRTCRRPRRSGVTQWYLCKRNTSRSPRSKACAQSGARRHALAVCRLLPAKAPPSKSVASESIRTSVKRECEEGAGPRPPRGRCGTQRSDRHRRRLQLQRLEHAPVGHARLTRGQLQGAACRASGSCARSSNCPRRRCP